MRAVIILLSALLPLCPSHEQDPFAWLYSRRSAIQTDTAGGECPPECDCPPTFSIAMYCDARGLTVMPSVPSRMKYLYLQNNAISAISDSALVNATNLVWLMMHHNRLTSGGISEKVNVSVTRTEVINKKTSRITQTKIEKKKFAKPPPRKPTETLAYVHYVAGSL